METYTIQGSASRTSLAPVEAEIDRYLVDGEDFINEASIMTALAENRRPDAQRVRDIVQKSLSIERLDPDETAALLSVEDEDLWQEMHAAGLEVKRKVYDNRIVFFAPLYCSSLCVNNCLYCGFRRENEREVRRILSSEEVQQETRAMVEQGHKRMIIVYGEHPRSNVDYMVETIRAVYGVRQKAPRGPGVGNIRRVNVNAAPMSIAELHKLWQVGIGTYQVFQETYHKGTYRKVHPSGPKADYRWRLYALHRAMEAGIDDLGAGVLFGLYDWRFEVMGLLYHTIDLEKRFGIGPHTISFPRMTPASGSAFSTQSPHLVGDRDFKRLVTVLRLAVPYTGMIITARESARIRDAVLMVGCTQTDASTRIGIGGYNEALKALDAVQRGAQTEEKQQFILGDTRSLDQMTRELAAKNMIVSFCTAGYRCGRTGDKIMGLLKNCVEGKFCKLNAVLTYREYLDDYASEETRAAGERVIAGELEEVRRMPFFQRGRLLETFEDHYRRVCAGERDLYL